MFTTMGLVDLGEQKNMPDQATKQDIHSEVEELKSAVALLEKEHLLTKLELNQMSQNSSTELKAEMSKTKELNQEKFDRLESELSQGKWSPGSYCIFASGTCPPGFARHEGHMLAISTYSANTNYIKEQQFGDSRISCHGPCGKWPNWYGELFIVVCCK